MAQATQGSEAVSQRANELYWSGSGTVDEIVAELGISRSALYASIEPVPAGLVCADCDERMVHTNRTMRDRGVAVCPNCGRESDPGEVVEAYGEEPESGRGPAGSVADELLGRWAVALRAVPAQRVALVAGGAALGIVAGAAAAHLLRD